MRFQLRNYGSKPDDLSDHVFALDYAKPTTKLLFLQRILLLLEPVAHG